MTKKGCETQEEILWHELYQLRKQTQRLWFVCSALVILLSAPFLAAFHKPAPAVQDVVTAKKFVLVDDKGTPLATLGFEVNGTTEGAGATVLQLNSPDKLSFFNIRLAPADNTGHGSGRMSIGASRVSGGQSAVSINVSRLGSNSEFTSAIPNDHTHFTPRVSITTDLLNGAQVRACGNTSEDMAHCKSVGQQFRIHSHNSQ